MMVAAVFLGLVLGAAQEAKGDDVSRLLETLNSDDSSARDRAEADLVRLGPAMRPRLEAAMGGASEEARRRIRSVLKAYVAAQEEEFALSCLKRGDPFPKAEKVVVKLSDSSFAEALSKWSTAFKVKVDFYPEDDLLPERAAKARFPANLGIESEEAEMLLSGLLMSTLEATYVVDRARVVVVRLTPRVLLARLGLEPDTKTLSSLERDLSGFAGPSPFCDTYWAGVHHFLCILGRQERESRTAWFGVLSTTAKDDRASAEDRCRALSGLSWMDLGNGDLAPDVAKVFLDLAAKKGGDEVVRRKAIAYLGYIKGAESTSLLLSILETGDDRTRSHALLTLGVTLSRGWSPWPDEGMGEDEARRWREILRTMESSSDSSLSFRATCVASMLGSEGAAVRVGGLEIPADAPSRILLLEALRTAALRKKPGILDLLEKLASHPEEEIRAQTMQIIGATPGGKDRSREAAMALRSALDDSPVVRWAAWGALGMIYEPNAPDQCFDGLGRCLKAIDIALGSEKDPKVVAELKRVKGRIREERTPNIRYTPDVIPAPLKK